MKKILIILVVLSVMTLACGITVRATAPQPPPAAVEATAQQVLQGRTAVVFGDENFVASAKADAEAVGMVVLTAFDLESAVELAGNEAVEFHCVNVSGQEVVVQASHPSKIFWDGKQPITDCLRGAIFVGFYTDESPDVTIP